MKNKQSGKPPNTDLHEKHPNKQPPKHKLAKNKYIKSFAIGIILTRPAARQ